MEGSENIDLSRTTSRKDVPKMSELVEVLATIVAVRGARLSRLAQTISTNVERDLFESDLDHRDSEVRRLLFAQHVQLLRDAVRGGGAFVGDSSSLLSLRWMDRAAFEAYAQLHARLCPSGIEGRPGMQTTQDMLLALRLRMARLDWASIAELFESLGRPCEETALRKRQSRIASMAAVAGFERQWRAIDGYLKAKRRSYGGTPRKLPLIPLTVLVLSVVGLSAAAWVVLRSMEGDGSEVTPVPRIHETRPQPAPTPAPEPLQESRTGETPKPRPSSPPSRPTAITPDRTFRLLPDQDTAAAPDGLEQVIGEVRVVSTLASSPSGVSACVSRAQTEVRGVEAKAILNALTSVDDYTKWITGVTRFERIETDAGEGEQSAFIVRAALRNRVQVPVEMVWRVVVGIGPPSVAGVVSWNSNSRLLPEEKGVVRLDGSDFVWSVVPKAGGVIEVCFTAWIPRPPLTGGRGECDPLAPAETLNAFKAFVEARGRAGR